MIKNFASGQMGEVDFNLYLITDRNAVAGNSPESLINAVEGAFKGGVKVVQLREKDLSARQLMEIAEKLVHLANKYGTKIFINDRIDVALALKAHGVHLPESGFSPEDVKRLAGDRLLIGTSTHSVEKALEAEKAGADFITFGPVYETPSKKQYGAPVGIESLKETIQNVKIPVFAIGGITIERCSDIKSAGAKGIALISGIMAHKNPERAASEYLAAIEGNL